MIKLIAAVEQFTQGIGYGNQLPWPIIPEDLKHFRDTTIGKTIVMGSLTFLSFGELPLPNRKNVVITRKKRNFRRDVIQVQHPEQILKWKGDVYIIGGASIYSTYMEAAGKMIITELDFPEDVQKKLKFDKFFPTIKKNQWDSSSSEWQTSTSGAKYRIVTYSRKKRS